MSNLDKAREWAESVGNIEGLMPGTRATVEVIQSLPDQWVDVEKVREAISGQLSVYTRGTVSHYIAEEITRNLEALITPKLTTLAELIEAGNDPKRYEWMQCKIEDTDRIGVITGYDEVGEFEYCTSVTFRDEADTWFDPSLVIPLPDLPKLQWPAQEPRNPETPPAETLNNTSSDTPRNPRPEECCGKCPETVDGGYDCTCEDNPRCSKNTPNPEDVPPNEPWMIKVMDEKAVGARYAGNSDIPWSVAALDGSFAGDYNDREVALIHKLVPETPALPEGMRLADHEEYGRVVVSPKDDLDSDYRVFCSQDHTEYGADWWYAHKSELTFLDGDQHA